MPPRLQPRRTPTQKFSIVDYAFDPTIPNVLGQVFTTDQAGFLAGYVAAGVSKTGKIGTFGGIQIPPVTVFMDGFALGAKAYNEKHGTNVQVLGWDPVTQTGLFTGNFESTDDGRTMGQTLDGRRRRHHHAGGWPGWVGHGRGCQGTRRRLYHRRGH